VPWFEVVCLANSRKSGARCIAGIDLTRRVWRRPVSGLPGGELYRQDYTLDNGQPVKPLDVFRIHVARRASTHYQPENWTITSDPWRHLRTLRRDEAIELLTSFAVPGPVLLRGISDRIAESALLASPIEKSLAIVQPQDLRFVIDRSYAGNRQTRASFMLSGQPYDLSVTDLVWEHRLRSEPMGEVAAASVDIARHSRVFLTISLSEPFYENCFKLVAAVIVL
jgi:hypothetical protein